jgi:hypothetical protein
MYCSVHLDHGDEELRAIPMERAIRRAVAPARWRYLRAGGRGDKSTTLSGRTITEPDRDELVIVVQAVTNHMIIRCDLLKKGLGMGAVPQYNN